MLTVCMSIPSCRLIMILETPASRYFHLEHSPVSQVTPTTTGAAERGNSRCIDVLSIWHRGHQHSSRRDRHAELGWASVERRREAGGGRGGVLVLVGRLARMTAGTGGRSGLLEILGPISRRLGPLGAGLAGHLQDTPKDRGAWAGRRDVVNEQGRGGSPGAGRNQDGRRRECRSPPGETGVCLGVELR